MRVSISGLKAFKELYATRFQEDLNDVEALRKAQAVLNVFEVIFGSPFPVDEKDVNCKLTKSEDSEPASA